MATILLTLVWVLHGIGVPIQYTDPDLWAAQYPDIPFVTWRSNDCHHANAIPLVWRSELPQANCDDGRPLLLYNEPVGKGQSDLTPVKAAQYAMQHQAWNGRIYCCGTLTRDEDWDWIQEFLGIYTGRLDGLHVHTYVYRLDTDGPRWRQLADDNGWDIIVSEWGAPGGSQEESVTRNAAVLPLIVAILRPSMLFYFSWNYGWANSDLSDGTGTLTLMGEWWMKMAAKEPVMWVPWLCS